MVLPEFTTLAEARDAIRDLAEEVEKLSNELAWFKRQMFGSKTEHYIPEDPQEYNAPFWNRTSGV